MARSLSNMSASELFRRASSGDESAFAQLLQYHRPTLRRMISLRLDRRIRGRLDPSDVIQDAFITAARRFSEYVDNPSLPFYLWLRTFAVQTLINHYRRHLGAQSRDVGLDKSAASKRYARALVRLKTILRN